MLPSVIGGPGAEGMTGEFDPSRAYVAKNIALHIITEPYPIGLRFLRRIAMKCRASSVASIQHVAKIIVGTHQFTELTPHYLGSDCAAKPAQGSEG
jgi:hypothetical protein